MKDSKKLEFFKEALKKAKEGDLFNYDIWLRECGADPNKMNLKHFERYFWANPDNVIGNEKIFEKIAVYIGHFLKNKSGVYHIAIIGVKGSGKTLFLRILKDFIDDVEPNMSKNVDIVSLEKYLSSEPDKDFGIRSKNVRIHFIDNCEKVKGIIKIFLNIRNIKGEGVYISTWTPESWLRYKNGIKDILPLNEEIILQSLEHNYRNFFRSLIWSITLPEKLKTESFLEGNIYASPSFIDLGDFEDPNGAMNLFLYYTLGNPLLTIKMLFNSVKKTFLSREEEVTKEIIKETAREMDLHRNTHIKIRLTKQHLQLLSNILHETNGKGIRPMQLVEIFKLDKSTISYHLKLLKELEVIEDNKIGKSTFYKVKENLIPFIQSKILNVIYLKKESAKE